MTTVAHICTETYAYMHREWNESNKRIRLASEHYRQRALSGINWYWTLNNCMQSHATAVHLWLVCSKSSPDDTNRLQRENTNKNNSNTRDAQNSLSS